MRYRIEFKWALLFTLMMMLWMWLEKLTGLHDEHIDKHAVYTNLVAIPSVLIFVLALRDKKKNDYAGKMSYGQGFLCGFIISLIVALLSPLTQLMTSVIISPDYFSNIIEYSVNEMGVDRQAAESNFNLSNYMLMGAIGALIMGTITSAIVALFTKSK